MSLKRLLKIQICILMHVGLVASDLRSLSVGSGWSLLKWWPLQPWVQQSHGKISCTFSTFNQNWVKEHSQYKHMCTKKKTVIWGANYNYSDKCMDNLINLHHGEYVFISSPWLGYVFFKKGFFFYPISLSCFLSLAVSLQPFAEAMSLVKRAQFCLLASPTFTPTLSTAPGP